MRINEIRGCTPFTPKVPKFVTPVQLDILNSNAIVYDGNDKDVLKVGIEDATTKDIISYCIFTDSVDGGNFRHLAEMHTVPSFAGNKLCTSLVTYIIFNQFGVYFMNDAAVSSDGRKLIKSLSQNANIELSTTAAFTTILSQNELAPILNSAHTSNEAIYLRKIN